MRLITSTAPTVREAARRLGRQHQAAVWAHAKFVRTWVAGFGRRWPWLVRTVAPLQAAARRHTPEAWEYLTGLAAGSRLPVRELFAVNSYDLLDNRYLTERRGEDHCTDVLYRSRTQAWLAHNEDWGPAWWPHAVLLTVRTPRVQWSALTYIGELPGYACGGNSHGLAYSCDSLNLQGDGYGLPLPFALFHANVARSAAAALERLLRVPHGSSVHVNVLDRRTAVSAELRSSGESYLRHQPDGYLAHTNHCLPEGPFAGADRHGRAAQRHSTQRYRRVLRLLARRPLDAAAAAEDILADTRGREKIFSSRTLARCTFDLAARRLTVYGRDSQVITLPFGLG